MNNIPLYQTSYDKQSCNIGIVHIGYGNFHRAHQAVYIDDYMETSGDLNWGIAAVNLRKSESETFETAAQASDGYIVKTIAPDSSVNFRLVRSHIAFIDASSDQDAAFNILNNETVKTLTITVTESGYYLDQNNNLDLSNDIIKDSLNGTHQETIYAYLSAALQCRADGVSAPITILSCDNMRSNGTILKNALLSYISAMGNEALSSWVRENVTFPCSMVDRITPQSSQALSEEISERFHHHATAPVHAETFIQWVIENNFANDMPSLDQVGVQIVPDVEPFEEAKIRILNGGHSGLAYLGVLAGHQTFDEAMRDPLLEAHFNKFEIEEVLHGLGTSIPFDTKDYLSQIKARFENSGIADNLERICMDGYSKMAIYIRPTLESCLEKGIIPEAGFDTVASWIIYARRCKEGISSVPYHEPCWDKLLPMIEKGHEAELASDPNLWGDLPERFDSFVPNMVTAIHRMDEKWQA